MPEKRNKKGLEDSEDNKLSLINCNSMFAEKLLQAFLNRESQPNINIRRFSVQKPSLSVKLAHFTIRQTPLKQIQSVITKFL